MTIRGAHAALCGVLRRNLFLLLTLAYVLATLVPGPGNALRQVSLARWPISGATVNPTHLLLGFLLFSVGLSLQCRPAINKGRDRRMVGTGLLLAWLIPVLALAIVSTGASALLPELTAAEWLLGAALVVSMPPANSAAVWTDMSGGRVGLVLAIMVVATLLSPAVTPLVLQFCSGGQSALQIGVSEMLGSLESLLACVVAPTLLGVGVRSGLDRWWAARVGDVLEVMKSAALVALFGLNYANGAVALPQLGPQHAATTALAVAGFGMLLCATAFLIAWGSACLVRTESAGELISLVYITSMKNTGAALVLAASLFEAHPLAVLVPVFYAMTQHVLAAGIDRFQRRELPAPVDSEPPQSEVFRAAYCDSNRTSASRGFMLKRTRPPVPQ